VAYGSNAFGIKSAAQTFFGKRPIDLTVEEAAMLVGVVNAPTRFSPVRNPDNALKRRNTVIDRMYSSGYINREQLDSIIIKPINLNYNPISHDEGLGTYFRSMLSQYMTASEPKRKNFYNDWDFNTAQNLWNNDPLYGWCTKNRKADGTTYNLYRDGLKIYTTINSKMQRYAEEAVNENMSESVQPRFSSQVKRTGSLFFNLTNEEKNQIINRAVRQSDRYRIMKNDGVTESEIIASFKKPTDMNIFAYNKNRGIDTIMSPMDSILYAKGFLRAGFVAIEPSSGYVKAYVGGVNHRFFKYDMASQGKRQAGSTFKPFVYTFAIDQLGLSPCQMVPNSPVTVDGWSPKEAGNVEQIGEMRPLWWGLAMSRNNFSAWIMKQANQPKAVAEFINRLGIGSYIDPVAPLCLGSADVSLFEMVGAYTNFVNNGVHIEPIFVTRIEDKHGNLLATFSPRSSDAISSQSAYTMLSMLQKVVNSGTAGRLRRTYQFTGEMGGKTGTSNKNADSWFIGITPKIVAGSWIGGEDRSTHFLSGGEGSVVSLPSFGRFMKKVYADPSLGITEKDAFIRPVGAMSIDCSATTDDSEVMQPQTLIDEDGFFD
ncbi:MAG: penicillin-binding transpeptidase domain-containing protein, partial [Rikenellaceae bacterium]